MPHAKARPWSFCSKWPWSRCFSCRSHSCCLLARAASGNGAKQAKRALTPKRIRLAHMPAKKCAKSFEPFPPPAGFSCLHIRFLISDRIRSNPFFTPNAPTPTFINRILVNGERVDLQATGCLGANHPRSTRPVNEFLQIQRLMRG